MQDNIFFLDIIEDGNAKQLRKIKLNSKTNTSLIEDGKTANKKQKSQLTITKHLAYRGYFVN